MVLQPLQPGQERLHLRESPLEGGQGVAESLGQDPGGVQGLGGDRPPLQEEQGLVEFQPQLGHHPGGGFPEWSGWSPGRRGVQLDPVAGQVLFQLLPQSGVVLHQDLQEGLHRRPPFLVQPLPEPLAGLTLPGTLPATLLEVPELHVQVPHEPRGGCQRLQAAADGPSEHPSAPGPVAPKEGSHPPELHPEPVEGSHLLRPHPRRHGLVHGQEVGPGQRPDRLGHREGRQGSGRWGWGGGHDARCPVVGSGVVERFPLPCRGRSQGEAPGGGEGIMDVQGWRKTVRDLSGRGKNDENSGTGGGPGPVPGCEAGSGIPAGGKE